MFARRVRIGRRYLDSIVEAGFVEEWLGRYGSAWETANGQEAAQLFTYDASYRSHIFAEAHRGPEEIEGYWQDATSTQSHVTVRWGDPLVDATRVAVEWWTTMVDHEDGEITLPGILLLGFRADACFELREYWHAADGHREPFPGWGAVASGDAASTRASAEGWAASYERAWRAGDARAAAELYSPKAQVHTDPFRDPARSREDVLAYTRWAYASERDTEARFGRPVVMGGGAAVEWWAATVGDDGVPRTLAGCSLLSFDAEGFVASAREYWHEADGRREPPGSWGS